MVIGEGESGKPSLRGSQDVEARREAARLMGSVRSEAKRAASRANGRKAPPGPGRRARPLSEFACTCGRGDALEGHPTIDWSGKVAPVAKSIQF